MDASGFDLILTAWAVLWAGVWKRRHLLPATPGSSMVGLRSRCRRSRHGILHWSILSDHGAWWTVGAVALARLRLAAAIIVTIRKRFGRRCDSQRPSIGERLVKLRGLKRRPRSPWRKPMARSEIAHFDMDVASPDRGLANAPHADAAGQTGPPS